MVIQKIAITLGVLSSPLFAMQQPTGFTTVAECVRNGAAIVYNNESKQYVLSLTKGIVLGEGALVTAGGKVLSDTETYKSDQHRLVSGERDTANYNKISFDGALAVISSPGQQCYYHWLLQILPRLKVLQEANVSYDKIYLFKGNFKFKWQHDSLYRVMDHLSIPHERLFLVGEDVFVEAKALIIPSIPWIPSKAQSWDADFLPWYKKFFCDVFLPAFQSEVVKRIFISRSNARYRRINNEEDLMDFLAEKGFSSVKLEDLPLSEQAALFNNAEIIVGPHGAGWANLIFCKQGAQIIEIDHGVKDGEQRSAYKGMARRMDCNYNAFYVGSVEDTGCSEDPLDSINQDMSVDIEAFGKFAQDLGI